MIELIYNFFGEQTFKSTPVCDIHLESKRMEIGSMQQRKSTGILIIGILLLPCLTSACSAEKNTRPDIMTSDGHFYFTYAELTELLIELQTQYPEILSYYSLTKTYQGRQVWVVKISDNAHVNESEPQILFLGGVHGNERPGFQAVIYSLQSILENYTTPFVNESFTFRIRQIVNTTELFFIPMVNPDGVEAFTRKNCKPNQCLFGKQSLRGVDINRNYDYNWNDAFVHPCRYIVFPQSLEQLQMLLNRSTNNYLFERTAIRFPITDFGSWIGQGYYRGPKPFSENESSAVKTFLENKNVTISVDYHSYGEKILYPQPWRYMNPIDNATFLSLAENVSIINGYTVGQRMNWSNFSGNYPYWAYTTLGMYPLTIELCKTEKQNQNPDEEALLRLFYTQVLVNLYLAEKTRMI